MTKRKRKKPVEPLYRFDEVGFIAAIMAIPGSDEFVRRLDRPWEEWQAFIEPYGIKPEDFIVEVTVEAPVVEAPLG